MLEREVREILRRGVVGEVETLLRRVPTLDVHMKVEALRIVHGIPKELPEVDVSCWGADSGYTTSQHRARAEKDLRFLGEMTSGTSRSRITGRIVYRIRDRVFALELDPLLHVICFMRSGRRESSRNVLVPNLTWDRVYQELRCGDTLTINGKIACEASYLRNSVFREQGIPLTICLNDGRVEKFPRRVLSPKAGKNKWCLAFDPCPTPLKEVRDNKSSSWYGLARDYQQHFHDWEKIP